MNALSACRPLVAVRQPSCPPGCPLVVEHARCAICQVKDGLAEAGLAATKAFKRLSACRRARSVRYMLEYTLEVLYTLRVAPNEAVPRHLSPSAKVGWHPPSAGIPACPIGVFRSTGQAFDRTSILSASTASLFAVATTIRGVATAARSRTPYAIRVFRRLSPPYASFAVFRSRTPYASFAVAARV